MDMTLPPAVPVPDPPKADRPAHYRLSTETWLLIVKEYREGATAPYLASKWRVSEHALRRRITQHGATKRDWGDSQAIAMATAREAELEEARRNSPEAVAARLFAGLPMPADDGTLEDGAEDPAALARMATLASGRAMRGRLWAEARALGALAETYQRLAAREAETEAAGGGGANGGGRGAALTPETAPLGLIHAILTMDAETKSERFRMDPDAGEGQPDHAIKKAYWRDWKAQGDWLRRVHFRREALERRVEALEAALTGAGLPLPQEHSARRAARLAED
ncbi:hypothetical protein [Brevundimonas sp.]|uniref:hypothetical protein n=2 Tax=Brevundimonas sp. TaxID=1871086 RepID=UPI00355A03B1